MTALPRPPSGVLFDLDGTLLDSAPGLYAALEAYGQEIGRSIPPFTEVREVVSRGASAVLAKTFPDADADAIAAHSPRFLTLYADIMASTTQPFAGVDDLLRALETDGTPWGIVTNKAGFLTQPLLQSLGLWTRASVVVAGDTLDQRKPDPAPVQHACARANMTPERSIYVGDDPRDVLAGQAAGLATVAAAWGYLDGADPLTWGAEAVVESPHALGRLLASGVSA